MLYQLSYHVPGSKVVGVRYLFTSVLGADMVNTSRVMLGNKGHSHVIEKTTSAPKTDSIIICLLGLQSGFIGYHAHHIQQQTSPAHGTESQSISLRPLPTVYVLYVYRRPPKHCPSHQLSDLHGFY